MTPSQFDNYHLWVLIFHEGHDHII